jgi:transposase
VQQHLQTSKIILHFLPVYSPNLNPIERLWKWMKERVLYNTYYREFDDFKTAVLGFFATLSLADKGSELSQCFRRRVRDQFRPIGISEP